MTRARRKIKNGDTYKYIARLVINNLLEDNLYHIIKIIKDSGKRNIRREFGKLEMVSIKFKKTIDSIKYPTYIYVSNRYKYDCTTITQAIDIANKNDTIYVDYGVYYEKFNITKPLTIIGIPYEYKLPKIIYNKMTIYIYKNVTFEKLYIMNSHINTNKLDINVTSIFNIINGANKVKIHKCKINTTDINTIGICSLYSKNIEVMNTIIKKCRYSIYIQHCNTLTIEHSLFKCIQYGIVFNHINTIKLLNNTIVNNINSINNTLKYKGSLNFNMKGKFTVDIEDNTLIGDITYTYNVDKSILDKLKIINNKNNYIGY
tara:strand:+ start:1356 stop:2306 length:951 start_codon:yes stop_codon:yes gene_type:complete